jgi:hypothetical protein
MILHSKSENVHFCRADGQCRLRLDDLATVRQSQVAPQRSFMAVEDYSTTEGDQLRVQDYIDGLRRRALLCNNINLKRPELLQLLPK